MIYIHGIGEHVPKDQLRLKWDLALFGKPMASQLKGRDPKLSDFQQLCRTDSGTMLACPHVLGLLAASLSVRREFIGRPDETATTRVPGCPI
jgi:hypothetical protein